jgi:hypothetical protein
MKKTIMFTIAMFFFFAVLFSVEAIDYVETPSASYVIQSYNRGTGFYYKVGADQVNLTYVTRASIEVGNNLVVYNNGTSKYFEGNTWNGDVQTVGIELNASTVYAIMIYPTGCGARNNAHDTGLNGNYPIATNKGSISCGVFSTATCGEPEICTITDGYSLASWNVSIPGGIPPELTLYTDLVNNQTITDNPFILYFNGTVSNVSSIFNCSFYVNNTLNQTKNDINVTINQNFTIDTTLKEEKFDFNVTCINENASDSFLRTNIYIDTITNIIECNGTVGEIVAYNFTLRDETDFSTLTGNIYVDLIYLNQILSFQKQNTSFLALCLPVNANYNISGQIISDVSFTNRYFFRNAVFDNVTNEMNLYNFNDTDDKSTLVLTLRDTSFFPYSNIIAKLERYYPANHTWMIVQQDISDEFGQVFFNIIELSTEYRFSFYTNTTLLDSTNTIKFLCTDSVCQVSFQVSPEEEDQSYLNIITNLDTSTNVLDVNWSDATGDTDSIRVTVDKETMTGTIGICDASIYSSGGSYQCNVSLYTGGVKVNVYSPASDDVPTLNKLLTVDDTTLGDFLSITQSAFWSFVILLLFIGLGLVSPVAVIVMTMFGIFIISLTGINPIVDIMFLIVVGVIGIAISIKVKQ